MSHEPKYRSLWDYLDESAVLEWGSEDQIKEAKKEYKKLYQRAYRRNYRRARAEFTVSLFKDEEVVIRHKSKDHKLSPSAFIKQSALAYIQKLYLVPDPIQLAQFEQILNLIFQEIKIISQSDSVSKKYPELLSRIEQIERELSIMIRHPHQLKTEYDLQVNHTPQSKSF